MISIDLGYNNNRIGIFKNKKIQLISINNKDVFPSSILFNSKNDEIKYGESTRYNFKKNYYLVSEIRKLFNVKRKNYQKESNDRKNNIIIDEDGEISIEIQYDNAIRRFSIRELMTMLLSEIRKEVNICLRNDEDEIIEAIVTVPVDFDKEKRNLLYTAAEEAKLKIVDLLDETTAASIKYCYERRENDEDIGIRNVLLYDLGTYFSAALVKVDEINKIVQVIDYVNDTNLGGKQITEKVVNYFSDMFSSETGESIEKSQLLLLQKACEEAKRVLNNNSVAYVQSDILEDYNIDTQLTSTIYESIITPLCRRTIEIVCELLNSHKDIKIDDIMCIGGSCRIKTVEKCLREEFPKVRIINKSPEEVIVSGAVLFGNDKDYNFKTINVSHYDISTDLEDGSLYVMIPKKSKLPCSQKRYFGNYESNQESLDINIYAGDGTDIQDSRFIDCLRLPIKKMAPSRQSQFKVIITVDEDENIKIEATELATSEKHQICCET